MRSLLSAAAAACVFVLSTGQAHAQEANWLDERAWPAFVSFSARAKVNGGDSDEVRLLKERYNAVQHALSVHYLLWLQGEGSVKLIADAAVQTFDAKVELEGPAANKVAILKEMLGFAKLLEEQAKSIHGEVRPKLGAPELFRKHRGPEEYLATHFRADTELKVLRAPKPE